VLLQRGYDHVRDERYLPIYPAGLLDLLGDG